MSKIGVVLQLLQEKGFKLSSKKLSGLIQKKFEGEPEIKKEFLAIARQLKEEQTIAPSPPEIVVEEDSKPQDIVTITFDVRKADLTFSEEKKDQWSCIINGKKIEAAFNATEAEKEAIRLSRRISVSIKVLPYKESK